jgi:hypothetical protein
LLPQFFNKLLAYFRDYEDRAPDTQIIRDDYEGTRAFMPEGGVIIRNRTTGQISKFTEPWAFESLAKADEIFVFCVSNSYNNVLIREFTAEACVEIANKSAFFTRLNLALPPAAKLIHGNVKYYRKSDDLGTLWALPDEIVTSKLDRFAYQDEYRFAFSTTGAFDAGKTRQRLIGRNSRPAPNPSEHHEQKLQLGSLRDICKLHKCDQAILEARRTV